MNRQRVLAAAIVCALVGAALYAGRGVTHNLAAKSGVDPGADPLAPKPAIGPAPEAAASTVPAAEQPPVLPTAPLATEAAPLPEPQNGLQDVDPHKAFGSKNAPVVMEIFSDYQCPMCKNLFLTTNRQLMDNYVTTGKVYLIHRDFPLPMHAYSRIAARYVRAAAQLGKVESVEQAIYQNQEKWEQTGDVDGTVASVLTPSEMNKVRALVKGGTLEPLIEKDLALGQMYRVNSTPTTVFHCKGQTYPSPGFMTYDTLKQFLEQLLSQK